MNRIRALREARGYSQKELGKMINRTNSAISKWEKEQREPSKEDERLLCHVLKATLGYLRGDTDINDYVEQSGDQIPKSLRDEGLEKVEGLRIFVDEHGGIHPDVQRKLLQLVADAKLLQDSDLQKQDTSGPGQ